MLNHISEDQTIDVGVIAPDKTLYEEKGIEEKNTASIKKFINEFRISSEYQEALRKFLLGKNFIEEYKGEARDKFEELDNARQAMIKFSENGFKLDYEIKGDEKNNPIYNYLELIKDFKRHPSHFENAKTYESIRGEYHDLATMYIKNKCQISSLLSTGITQLIAIQNGLESYGMVDANRVEKKGKIL